MVPTSGSPLQFPRAEPDLPGVLTRSFSRRSFLAVMAFSRTALRAAPSLPDLSLYEGILQKFVRADGLVDYAGIRDSIAPLAEFQKQIAAVSPDSHPQLFPSKEDKLAYWINAYNSTVLHAFAREYPQRRTRLRGLVGRAQFFYTTKHPFGGVRRSLDDIETNNMRRGPLKDVRIHFAIVCASASCPRLAQTAYRASTLNARLQEEARKFLNEPRNYRENAARKEVWLPQIFEWFGEDWGKPMDVRRFIAGFRPGDRARLEDPSWRVRYIPYDWSPNDVRPTPAPSAALRQSGKP
jgi:hypothetical protein